MEKSVSESPTEFHEEPNYLDLVVDVVRKSTRGRPGLVEQPVPLTIAVGRRAKLLIDVACREFGLSQREFLECAVSYYLVNERAKRHMKDFVARRNAERRENELRKKRENNARHRLL